MSKNNMTKAEEKLKKLVQDAYEAIRTAERVADDNGLVFFFILAYGMGGTYYPEGYDVETGWHSSSASC